MKRESIIKKYENKKNYYSLADHAVLHLELKSLERRFKKEKRYDNQTRDLFEEINRVLCSDWPNLEFLVVNLLDNLAKAKKKPFKETVRRYAYKTEDWYSDYLLNMLKEQDYFNE